MANVTSLSKEPATEGSGLPDCVILRPEGDGDRDGTTSRVWTEMVEDEDERLCDDMI